MGGIAVVPFYAIWGKSLPSTLRGRFFGHRQLWGGLLAIVSGLIAKMILENDMIDFPLNFVMLFSLAFIFLSVSYIALGLVREPVEDVYERRLPFRNFLKKAFHIIQRNSNYRKFIVVEIAGGAGAMALPFYVLYLRENLGMELGTVGVLLAAQMLGSVLSNILWAHLSDFVGNKKVIQISTFIGLIVPLIALVSALLQNSLSYIILFILIGFYISGRTIGKDNYLLDIATSRERPKYISLTGTLIFPVSLFPLLGGIIVQYISYQMLFFITAMIVITGFILSFGLTEPRDVNIGQK
jgi:predicted MFS family arabinose efflux permease